MKHPKNIVRRNETGDPAKDRKTSSPAAAALIPGLPPSARITWRVTEPSTGLGGLEVVHTETAFEREALTSYRNLRQSGHAVRVSRWEIYRVRIESKTPLAAERFAFVEACSEDDACARVALAFNSVDRRSFGGVRMRVSAKSYETCLGDGVSADPELRLFEVAWSNGCVSKWVGEPVFLLPEPSVLTRRWAEMSGSVDTHCSLAEPCGERSELLTTRGLE